MKPLTFTLMLAFACHFSADGRTWTDQQGQTFDGQLIEFAGDEATFMRSSDRRLFTVPIDRLSNTDKKHIFEMAESEPRTSGNGDDLPEQLSLKLERLDVSTDNNKPESVQLSLKYNYRTVWEGRLMYPGQWS